MKLVGFNFTKIYAERMKDKSESIKFNTKMNLSSVDSIDSSMLKTKEELVKIIFNYILSYEPEFAKIELSGEAILALDSKIAKDVIKGFKNKSISDETQFKILNILLKKVNLKALHIEEELNLPFHLPIISLNKEILKDKENN